MLVYVSRRIVYVIPIVLSVALVCFLLVHITPGDPLVAVLPADASQELAAQLRAAYGFDRPLPVQFGLWLWRALNGDLGNSKSGKMRPGAVAAQIQQTADHCDQCAEAERAEADTQRQADHLAPLES